jgi:hypothetical protein
MKKWGLRNKESLNFCSLPRVERRRRKIGKEDEL